MDTRIHLLILVGVVGAAQVVASSQASSPYLAQRDALMPERGTSERTVERMPALEAAGGVALPRATEAIRCDSLSFAGGGPVCHTAAPEIRVERAAAGGLRIAAVRQTERGARVVARAGVRDLAQAELVVERQP